MGFDKTKVMREAEKYLAQGKIPAAIKEYAQIIKHEPEDYTALNMLGDLYARTGKKPEAMKCFERIAEHYREQGFTLKAIAMYKKIDRINPGRLEVASELATLYDTQGLVVDARTQYLIVVEAHMRAGEAQKALEVLHKVADLDPNNASLRLKLAEGYLREGSTGEAAEAFTRAGGQFIARGNHESARAAYQRALDLRPHDLAALTGLVTTHIQRGAPAEAAAILEREIAAQPDNTDLLSLQISTYLETEDAIAAERATAALFSQQASDYLRFVDVARLYLKQNDTASAARVLAGITEQMLAGHEENELVELVGEVLARDPDQVEALRITVRIHWWQRDAEKLRAALEHLAQAARAADLLEDEKSALTQLIRLVPDQTQYLERLRELGGAPEDFTDQSQATFEPTSQEIPTFESFTFTKNEDTATDSTPGVPAEDAVEFEWNMVASAPAEAAPAPSDPTSSFADLNDWADAGAVPAAPVSSAQPEQTGFQEFDFDSVATQVPPTTEAQDAQAPPDVDDPYDGVWRQELESVDFYIAQGYTDIAFDTLDMLERQFGASDEIATRRAALKKTEPPVSPAAPSSTPETVEFSDFTKYDVAEAPVEEGLTIELDDAFTRLAPAAPPPPTQTAPPEQASSTVSAKHNAGIDPGLAAIFEEFRVAEEEEDSALNGDYETHYNLGLAYKEMDLLDESIEEFQAATALVAPHDGTARYLQCCNLLGHCFIQKGMPSLAVTWFKKGLAAPGHTQDEYQALRYELGTAYEQMGDIDRAIEVFTEVYGINVSYRGVGERLRALQAQKAVNRQ